PPRGPASLGSRRPHPPPPGSTRPGDFVICCRGGFRPAGPRLAATGMGHDQLAAVRVWETATGREVGGPIRENSEAFCVTFDPTGRYLSRGGPEHTMHLQDTQTGKAVGGLAPHRQRTRGMTL